MSSDEPTSSGAAASPASEADHKPIHPLPASPPRPFPLSSLDYVNTELVFALVAPTGASTGLVAEALKNHLAKFGYEVRDQRLSNFAPILAREDQPSGSEYQRINSLMDLGDKLRERAGRGDVLALAAVATIAESRVKKPFSRVAHLLISVKHPDEVVALRRIYGVGFFLIGLYAPESHRLKYLENDKNCTPDEARRLIDRDQGEQLRLGQQTRDTFQLADVFISLQHAEDIKAQLWRFVDLVFGNPYHTSLRSGQLARQVGAVVLSEDGEIIGTGANDVPCWGGGQYWPGGPGKDHRDHQLGEDSNDIEIVRIAKDIVRRVAPGATELRELELLKALDESPLSDLTEFGRAVHAEMEALMVCARAAVSPRGGTLYATTFPCHNCAKHIVVAGVSRVVFVEPYPKSKALDLHSDAIALEEDTVGKVCFVPFVGVTARRYFDLFSMRLSTGKTMPRKDKATGKIAPWHRTPESTSRFHLVANSYIDRELLAAAEISSLLQTGKQGER